MEEARITIDKAFQALEEPAPCPLPERVAKVRWFLLPHEAWEYGHGRTRPVTRNSFTPKQYRDPLGKKDGWGECHFRPQRRERSQNRSFRLYIKEDADIDDDDEDSEGGLVEQTRVISRSITELNHTCRAICLCESCDEDLNDLNTRDEHCSHESKGKKKNIKKKLKSLLKIK